MVPQQYLKVRTNEWDGDESGDEWQVHYVLMETEDDDGRRCFDLYTDDGEGNGNKVCRGYHETDMRSMTLRLGEFVEWKEQVAA
jgi:hypothetical protein